MNTLFLASAAASEGLEISIDPRSFYIGGVDVSLSAVMGSVIVLILVALMWLLNKRIAKFTGISPRGFKTWWSWRWMPCINSPKGKWAMWRTLWPRM